MKLPHIVMSKEIKSIISEAVKDIASNYENNDIYAGDCSSRLPNRGEIINIIKDLRRVMFPGYFGYENIATSSPDYFIGHYLTKVYEHLSAQVQLAFRYNNCSLSDKEIEELTDNVCETFFSKISDIQKILLTDVEALFNGDPAANNKEEIIFSYPGLLAIFVYRIAHELYLMNVPFIPRIMTEYAHSRTGIDINAGATIGEYFFIDHGTGIVIGETTVIGKNVKIYQGVTLGGISTRGGQSLRGIKRHPTIEDNVTIYAGATILGGNTIIGKDTVIGGNTFITESVDAGTKVYMKAPELNFKNQ